MLFLDVHIVYMRVPFDFAYSEECRYVISPLQGR